MSVHERTYNMGLDSGTTCCRVTEPPAPRFPKEVPMDRTTVAQARREEAIGQEFCCRLGADPP